MLQNLLLPFSIYRLKIQVQMLQTQIKKMKSANYLTLQQRLDLANLQKMLNNLHEKEASLHHHWLNIGF